MKAAVLESKDVLVYKDLPDPLPFGERPVLVRVGSVGVCGSDVLRFAHDTAYHYPLVLGHEFSAVIEKAPEDSTFAPGDRVAVFPLLPRSDDPLTRVGEWALSDAYDYFGSRRDGGMCEMLWVPEANLVPVPSSMPLAHAATVEPAAVALHAVQKLRVPAAGTVMVVGAGPIGALAAQWLRILGWTRVLVADVDRRKLELMEQLGFEVLDASTQDAVSAAGERTGGRGLDAVVEASGFPSAFLQCLEAAAPQGQILLLGDLKGDVTIPQSLISSFIRRELVIIGTWNSRIMPSGRSEWDMVVEHIARGSLAVAPLISHVRGLEEAPELMADIAGKRIWSNKVVFAVSPEARAEARAHAAGGGRP
ncbi:galactitol-1-phosphate 5-dehydrogenase [Mycolicibacterium komossense]|uniref:Galactitol-1-phosphate 5-dehydrogenase n=1 Tax=Mycolicibacterium komossense TaxID=1779 RepID=A0ABT3CB83_9MYCO|nr:galactitol-1-phosphate 5-dehydrogenase [Mycolicibacterium komossense]MCV7226723.1 galactitol-1-phosphate 5-dehydrogenase [Mycolicibacterium komossense]